MSTAKIAIANEVNDMLDLLGMGDEDHSAVVTAFQSLLAKFDIEDVTIEVQKDGVDYFLAHCPERINPGDKKWNVENLPRVLGSTTSEGLELAYNFYSSILTGEIKKMSSIRVSEAVKIIENSFRDINIAFVNELAMSFDHINS